VTSLAAVSLVSTPLAIGLTAGPAHAAPVDITIVGTNDFHGRLLDGFDIPGAPEYAGALNSIRAENPNTVFAAAGDLIGATTFESFIQEDKPTIDIFNEMGLDVSAVGNHELDKGYDDLVNRVMAPESAANPRGGANWQYIAANLDEPGDADLIPPTWTETVGGINVGFVGAVTEALPSLVSPAGIEGVTVQDIVASTNTAADQLTAGGADVVVMLVHEGAPSTNCDAMDDDPTSAFGEIVTGANDNIDAIISGHTHLAYNCTIDGRPVVSAGQYGSHLNRLDFTVDDVTGAISSPITQSIIDVNAETFTADPEVQTIVDQAVADSEGPGSVVLGKIAAPFSRAQWLKPDGDDDNTRPDRTDNRGGESTLGNLVAEAQRWATRKADQGGAQIAFMNPGGLRDDMLGSGDDGSVTYREAANVQPFANTLVNMTMTGRQIRRVLKQQWQPEGSSRPFLRLGTSRGFEYAYNPRTRQVGPMWLRGKKIRRSDTFSVTVNSFLASGGDNFGTFAKGRNPRDTGQIDLQAMVDYMAAKAGTNALAPRYGQHAVGVRMPKGNKVRKGGKLKLKLSSLAMTYVTDLKDRRVRVRYVKRTLGAAKVDNSLQLAGAAAEEGGFDEAGKATVVVKIPKRIRPGRKVLRIVGNRTGTNIKVPIRVTRR
jgi:5'-nucleotidase